MPWLRQHPIVVFGTLAVLVVGWLTVLAGDKLIDLCVPNPRRHYRFRQLLSTLVTLIGAAIIGILWARLLQQTSTFLGLVAAGMAIALREPLLSLAARVAIFAGRIYVKGDRIEIDSMSGEVIDIGFVYTRILEIGKWIHGDQYSGRILQFLNNKIFGAAVYNYTKSFDYVWDEVELAITYQSNLKAASEIMRDVGAQYSEQFLQGAEREMRWMQHYFNVQSFELDPQVYVKVTTNWVELAMRYVVHPENRRAASTYIYTEIFNRICRHDEIQIGSNTMNVTLQQAKPQAPIERPGEDRERAA